MTYEYSRYTKVDSSGKSFSVQNSAYKNIRFALQTAKIITITQSDLANLPGLSYRLYEDVSYWRILLAYNGLNDPIQDIYVGMKLRVPTKASISQHMSAFRKDATRTITI